MALQGVSEDDFVQIWDDLKRTVSYRVVTKTTDPMSGSETSTFATAVDKDVVFFNNQNRWIFDKEGLVEAGDAYILADIDEGIKRYDQFTIDGQTFYLEKVIRRHVANVGMCDYGIAYQVT